MIFKNNVNTETGFDIFESEYIENQKITTGSNYMFGNGYLGYRGTPCDATKEDYAACIVTDTYDNADGKWRELCNVPNGLYAALNVDGQPFKVTDATDYRRKTRPQRLHPHSGSYIRQHPDESCSLCSHG